MKLQSLLGVVALCATGFSSVLLSAYPWMGDSDCCF